MRAAATQYDFVAQAVQGQRLMHFGDADFRRRPLFSSWLQPQLSVASVAATLVNIRAGTAPTQSAMPSDETSFADFDVRALASWINCPKSS
jgi:hypothetical protein